MLFHIRLFLSFMLPLVVSVNCFDALEEEDAGADDALRQALVLVEMLRSEYIKVLRENKDLAAAIKMVTTSSPSESLKSIENNTHGASTLAVNLVSTISGSGNSSGGVVKVSASPIPSANIPTSSSPPKKSISNFARHYKNLFGSGLSRRFMKQPSGKVRNKMKFRRNMPGNGATIGLLKTKHETKSSTKKAPLTTKSKTIRTSFKSKDHHRDHKQAKKTTKHNLKDKAKTKDPLVAQIASEILNEIKGSDLKNVHYLRNKIHDVLEKETHSETVKHKTSLKIHLGLSSRMPLPLPENNAFCFYVPESPLCGSMKRKRK